MGKLAVGHVSPMLLVTLRWLGVLLLLLVFARQTVQRDWHQLKHRLPYLFAMGALGFTGFNVLFYVSAHHTSALNIGILQGSIPVFALIGTLVVYGTRVTKLQVVGVIVTLLGVAVVATGGNLMILKDQALNFGDALMLLACCLYAGYAVALKGKPAVSPLSIFAILSVSAFLTSLPIVAYEASQQAIVWPTTQGAVVLLLIILLPSFVAQISFMRGVELIGPGRATIFTNLVPVFGSILAVLVLQEAFQGFHALSLLLVLAGIGLAELGKPR